jgi:ribosome silencing factor RsfS/YbeB/iojap
MTDKEFEELYSKLDAYVKTHVDEYRYKHTQGVVKAIEKYALKYGADVKKAKIAAVFHDACKGQNLGLEHGKAAARIIRDEFGVEDEDIINAIANHTVGRVGMSLLEKVIKLADLLEENRTYEDCAKIREYEETQTDINKVYLVLAKRQKEIILEKVLYYDTTNDDVIAWLEKETNKNMTNKELALFIAGEMDKRKASDIVIIDIAEKSGFADYFVIATASSLRQLSSLAVNLEDKLAEEGVIVGHIEGKGDSGWILMDYGDIIINLFTAEQREHYNIEKVWGDCIRVDFETTE